MEPKDAHQKPSEEQKAGVASSKAEQLADPRQFGRADVRTYWKLQAELDRANSEYRLGNYGGAAEILREVVDDPKQGIFDPTSRPESNQAHLLLYASACTLLALTYERLSRDREAGVASGLAVNIFAEWLSREGEYAIRYYGDYGIALHMVERGAEAIYYLRKAVSLYLPSPDTYRHLALALKEQAPRNETESSFYEEAKILLDEALSLAPYDSLAHKALGETFEAQGNLDEAVAAYQAAAIDMASIYQLDDAVSLLDHVLELDPDHAFALASKGQVLRLLGRNEEALEALDRALELDPTEAFTFRAKGVTLHSLRRHGEALEALDRALELDPSHVFALGVKGSVLQTLGRYEEALRVLDRASELAPDDAWIIVIRGGILHSLGRHGEALEALDQALNLESDYTFALGIKGQVLIEIADFEAAFQELARVDQPDAWILALKGAALEYIGAEREWEERRVWAQEARDVYEAAIRLDPDDPFIRVGLGNVHFVLGYTAEAKNEYRSVVEKTWDSAQNQDAGTLSAIAWCHYRLDQYEEAVRLFIDALSFNAEMISSQFDLALTMMCSKQYRRRALRECRSALEMARGKTDLRRRGLLYVALDDLKLALDEQRRLAKVEEDQEGLKLLQEAYKLLQEAYDEVAASTV